MSLTEHPENTACGRVSIIVLKHLGAYPWATSDSLTIAVDSLVTNLFDVCTYGKGIFIFLIIPVLEKTFP